MSAREPESCLQISGERRMTITIAAIAAASSKATNRDIMSAKEKEADIYFSCAINERTAMRKQGEIARSAGS